MDVSVDRELSTLTAAGMIEPVSEVAGTYMFRHALIQEAAYGEILHEDRASLHLAVAEAIERLHPDRPEEVATGLAYHFRRAGERSKAVDYLLMAGDRAAATFANTEALEAFREALELVDEEDDRVARIDEGIGDVSALTGHKDEARAAYDAAFAHASTPIERARLQRKHGNCSKMGPDFGVALDRFRTAQDLLGPVSEGRSEAWWHEWIQILLDRSVVVYFSGMLTDGGGEGVSLAEVVDELREPVERWGTLEQRAEYLMRPANLLALQVDRYRPSGATLDDARHGLAAARVSGNTRLIGYAMFELGLNLLCGGELPEAKGAFLESAEVAESIGDAEVQCWANVYLSVAYRLEGDLETTGTVTTTVESLARQVGVPLYMAVAAANRGWVAWRSGDRQEARRFLDDALDIYSRWPGVPYPFTWLARLPVLAIALDDDDLERAIEQAAALTSTPWRTLPDPVEAALRRGVEAWPGRAAEAADALAGAVRSATETGYL